MTTTRARIMPDIKERPTTEWQDQAACAVDDPEKAARLTKLFFPSMSDHFSISLALAICDTCPVKAECLQDALAWPVTQDFGIRGGLTEWQREKLDRRHPPKHPGHGTTAGYEFERKHKIGTCPACRGAEAQRARNGRIDGRRK